MARRTTTGRSNPFFDEAGAFVGATIREPSFFVFGAEDGMVRMRDISEESVRKAALDLRGFVRLPQIDHWPQLEATDRVSKELIACLKDLRTDERR